MSLDNLTCVLLVLVICSLIEQKVDQMAAELTKRQLEREDTALQYKRYLCGMYELCIYTEKLPDHPVYETSVHVFDAVS